ncbi:MAG: nucleotide exchange factor GrpE, partial [Actinobacteria bacterium]
PVEPGDTQGVASGDEPGEQAIRTDLADLERIAAERDEYLDALRRLQADFENYKKRMIKQQTEHLQRAAEDLVGKLSAGTDADRLRKGVELVYGELLGALEKAGLERIEALGKPFDPEEHEAVMHVEGEDGEPGVRDVVRTGYRLKGRVLRPAMVKVAT